MRRPSADAHLYRARLFCDRAALAEARRLVEKHGYGRRREELADLEAKAADWPESKASWPPTASPGRRHELGNLGLPLRR